MTRVLVIGYGNELRGDDAVGPEAARRAAAWGRAGINALAVHQLTPELAAVLAEAEKVLFVDAGAGGEGSAVRLQPEVEPGSGLGHASNPRRLLALTEAVYGRRPEAWLVTIPAADFGLGAGLSAAAEAGLSAALAWIEREVGAHLLTMSAGGGMPMELPHLIEALSDPAAYSHPAAPIEVRQTHISAVFLAGPFAYKIKKPVDLGFLDFSTPEKRRYFCEEEVRLNRRLAPHVYLGAVPVARNGEGLRVGGSGEAVEYAVQMTRLPDDATLEARLRRGDVGADFLETLARKLAHFHADAASGDHIAAFGRFGVVAGNARENLAQAASQAGVTVAAAVFDRLAALTESHLQRLRPLIEARARRGVPRDTHGDLRLDHIYWLPDRPEPENLAVIDCIEFNERFRYADPVADMAFLVMDLEYHGRRDLAAAFADAYFRAAGDEEGRALLLFYTAYRAAVRGKVEGLKAAEPEVVPFDRDAARTSAAAHWLLALSELEEAGRRPCLVLVGGLPGVGKSTLARALAERADFQVVRSDVVRRELAAGGEGFDLYTEEWNERTYAECLRRADRLLFEGRRVLIDATFREERMRRAFLDAAGRWAVPALFFECRADPDVVRTRLADRRGDASEADWAVYLRTAERREEPAPSTRAATRTLSTSGGRDQALAVALLALRQEGLD